MKFLFPFVILLCAGCLQTRSDVKAGEQGKVLQQQVTTLQKTNADVGSRFADIEEQVRFLNGRVEVLENKLMSAHSDADKAQKNSSEVIQNQNQKIQIFQEALTKMEQEQSKMEAEIANLKNQLAAAQEAQKSSASSAAASNKNPFDVAEELFAKKEHRQAILEYQKYRDKNPKGKNFAAATYKMGLSFQELGLKDEAKSFYEEVISKAPKSDEARKAKSRLQKIK